MAPPASGHRMPRARTRQGRGSLIRGSAVLPSFPCQIQMGQPGCGESEAEVPRRQPAKKHAHILLPGRLSSLIPREVSGSVTYLGFLFVKKQ